MKIILSKIVAIVCLVTVILCASNKQSFAQSSGATPAKGTNTVTVTAQEVDAELDRRIHYFDSIFGSIQKVEEYYGKPIAQLKKDFRADVEKELIADKTKKLNGSSK